jgi:hypothetical protein
MDERVCPRCGRTGIPIVGVKSKAGVIQQSLECRFCRYPLTEDIRTTAADQSGPKRPT